MDYVKRHSISMTLDTPDGATTTHTYSAPDAQIGLSIGFCADVFARPVLVLAEALRQAMDEQDYVSIPGEKPEQALYEAVNAFIKIYQDYDASHRSKDKKED